MDLYTYVASNDLPSSKALIGKFGYSTWGGQPLIAITNPDDIAAALAALVQSKSDSALMAIADIHPDKDLLFQKFQEEQNNSTPQQPAAGKTPCGCGGHSNALTGLGQHGGGKKDQGIYLTQTNAILALGIAMIAVAIIAKN